MTHISLCTNATWITAPARLLMCDTERGERNKPRSPLIHPVLMCKSCLWSPQQRFVLQVCKGLSQITWWGAELLKTWCTSTYRAMTSQLTNQTPVLKHGWREEWKRARWRAFLWSCTDFRWTDLATCSLSSVHWLLVFVACRHPKVLLWSLYMKC